MEELQHHPSHTWQAPVVEDKLQDVKSGLTEAMVVMDPGWAASYFMEGNDP